MKFGFSSLALALATTASIALAGSSAVPLDVKTGLWDMTYVTTIDGAPPIPPEVLAKMPPAQKAKIMERIGKPKTRQDKDCVTAKDLADGALGTEETGESCKRTVIVATASRNEAKLVCASDEGPRTGTMKVEALSRDALKAQLDMQSGATKINIKITGKWVATACGNVE